MDGGEGGNEEENTEDKLLAGAKEFQLSLVSGLSQCYLSSSFLIPHTPHIQNRPAIPVSRASTAAGAVGSSRLWFLVKVP